MYGGIYDETMTGKEADFCFVRYFIKQIQDAQLILKRDQLDVAADFEEAIRLILTHGKCPCIAFYRKMQRRPDWEYLIDTTILSISTFSNETCQECPYRKLDADHEAGQAVRLARESFGKIPTEFHVSAFFETCVSKTYSKALTAFGDRCPEYIPPFRRHFESARLFCQNIETEIGEVSIKEFLLPYTDEPVFQFLTLLAECQRKMLFPLDATCDDEKYAFRPQNWRELWTVAADVASLALQLSAFLPIFEAECHIETLDRSLADLQRIFTARFPRKTEVADRNTKRVEQELPCGVSMHALAVCYCRTNDEIAGEPAGEIRRINMRLRRLCEERDVNPAGKGKGGSVLYSLDCAAELLTAVLTEDRISLEKAKSLAFAARQKIVSRLE